MDAMIIKELPEEMNMSGTMKKRANIFKKKKRTDYDLYDEDNSLQDDEELVVKEIKTPRGNPF
jgi:hypothetical protein